MMGRDRGRTEGPTLCQAPFSGTSNTVYGNSELLKIRCAACDPAVPDP